jgi:histidinol-phosphate aminotransferase
MKVRLPFEPGVPSQMAGVAALTDHQFLEYYLELNQKGLKYIYGVFERLGINYIKSDANFVMCILDSFETADKIVKKLLTKGVIIRGLKSFGLPHCIRISIGLQNENEFFAAKFEEVLNEINYYSNE